MKCPNCGKEITDDSLFCEHCGAKVKTSNNQLDKNVTILGYTESFALNPDVAIYKDDKEVGSV